MSTNYDDIIAAATGDTPRRTRSGALKYQPADAEWSIDRLGELQDFYQTTYKRPLPIAVRGQGSVHNRLGYDHRSSADISLNPASEEGRALVAELQRRRIPFLAFESAIPGSSTGPHIHVGRPSPKTANHYGIGSVRRTKQQTAVSGTDDDYSDIISAATGETDNALADYADVISAAEPPNRGRAMANAAKVSIRPRPKARNEITNIADLRQADDTRKVAGLGELRQADEARLAYQRPSRIGQLRQLDEQHLAQRKRVEAEVRAERGFKSAIGMPQTLNPIAAVSDYLTGKTEDVIVREEVNRRMDEAFTEQDRLNEIVEQFTDEDRAQLTAAVNRMRGQGSVSRGIETGTQRMGSGLLYKLAALADLGSPSLPGGGKNTIIGDYLRRQAGRGEIAVSEIESDLPPDTRQQLADFAAHALSTLPEIGGAVLAGGPIGGFAALGGLEAAGRKKPFSEIARETAKGAVLGAVFQAAPIAEAGGPGRTFTQRAADTARSSAVIGTGTYGVEKAFGATDAEALHAAASNVVFHVGMRVPGEVGRLTQAAERALKTPEPIEGGRPTVNADLQARLARAEEASPSQISTQVAEQVLKTPPAEITTPRPPPATPTAAGTVPETPAAPSPLIERRATPRPEGYEVFSPERRAQFLSQLEALPTPELVQLGEQLRPAERAAEVRGATKRPLAELMRERAEAGPTEHTTINDLIRAGKLKDRRPATSDITNVEITGSGRNWTASFDTPSGRIVTEGFRSRAEAEQYADNYGKPSKPVDLSTGKEVDPTHAPVALPEPVIREAGPNRFTAEQQTAGGRTTEVNKTEQEHSDLVERFKQVRKEYKDAYKTYQEAKVKQDMTAFMPVRGSAGPERNRMIEKQQREFQKLTPIIRESGERVRRLEPEYHSLLKQLKDKGIDDRTLETGPEAINLLTGKPVEPPPPGEGGFFNLRKLFGGKEEKETPEQKARTLRERLDREDAEVRAKFQAEIAAEKGNEPFLAPPRTIEEAGRRYEQLASRMLYLNNHISDAPRLGLPKTEVDLLWKQHAETFRKARAVEKYIEDHGYSVNPLGEVVRKGESFPSEIRDRGQGGFVDLNEIREGLRAGKLKIEEAIERLRADFPGESELSLRARIAPQPRDPDGRFDVGPPGSQQAVRAQLRDEARKYQQQFRALDQHPARRQGLDIVSDDMATNYFRQLRQLAQTHQPGRVEAVDRAESFYNQGKYGQASMLAESVFQKLPDKVNQYGEAMAAISLVERGREPASVEWTKVVAEVRRRLKETGGLSGGGSTFYDVNKHPEGGRPDHAKIAYILEPVVAALRADAARLIAEGKLKAADYVGHIRTQANKMLQGEEFADWHPLNKSAAMGVLVDQLRKAGPPTAPPATPPTTEAPPPQRKRSLPPTLERSGRDPGTNLTYDRLPNETVNRRVEQRLADEGAEALEAWYRTAPESADRTAAHRVLVDHYTAESVRLADTAPQQAQQLWQRARDLSNLEAERATTLGQAIQQYSQLAKYTPAGVLREVSRLEHAGARVPEATTRRLTEAAHEQQRLDREVHRLEREVAQREIEAGEAPPPAEGEPAPTRPRRRYRPRADTVLDSTVERARRRLDEAAQRRRAQRAFIATQLRQLEQQQTPAGYWKRAMNITRGLMVSAFSTAMRNLQSQAVRFDIERLVDATEHTIRRSIGLDSDLTYRNIWRNTARQFRPGQTAEARELLSAHPAEYWRMFNAYAGGVEVPIPHPTRSAVERTFQTVERGVEMVNYVNRIQEFHVRSAEFLAEVDLHLRRDHNQTLEQYVRRNGIDAIPLDIVRRGVDKAMEVTFADMPLRDGAGGRLLTGMIEVGNHIPPTVSPVAFPRFMFNNLKFLYQHSPAGMLDLARRNQNRPRVIARSLVGTSMLLLAYQFRQSDHAGEKWYELKFGDTTLDARPFGPFSTYLFIAEAIRRANAGEKQFTLDEIAQAVGASVLGAGAGLALAEKLYKEISGGEWEKLQRTIKSEAGEWGRALLTPVRQVKDLIAAFDESQAVTRETAEEPFLGPIRESIPFASTDLPPAQRPTTATPIRQERPAVKATTGWRVITPKTFLEKELDQLNFAGTEIRTNTGIPAIDALEKRLMGPLMDELSRELEADTEYRRLSKKGRADYLREVLTEIREEVREMGEAEQPELYDQLREERKPRRQREFEQEQLSSPGLSSALHLGVPMTVPPRQPGEDDLSYRARLLQLARQRRGRLDQAVDFNLPPAQLRSRLHAALYSG